MNKPFIALLGGSFNPIHKGHMAIANTVLQEIEDSEVYFIPCGNPVHKSQFSTAANHRVNMIKLAIESQTRFHLSRIEIESIHPSYTINTLAYFRKEYKDHSIGFIMGMDTFLSLDSSWGENWRDLLIYAHLLVLPRAGDEYTLSKELDLFLKENKKEKEFLHKFKSGGIILFKEPFIDVSSTEIRKKIQGGENASTLLSKEVYDYIQQQQLYSE